MQLLDAPEKSQWLYASAKASNLCLESVHRRQSPGAKPQLCQKPRRHCFVPHDLLTRTAGDSYLLGDRTESSNAR